MKKISNILAALLIVTAATAQTNPATRYITPKANMVMSFNPVSIAKKVPGETFRQSELYKGMMKNDDGKMKAFFADPSLSGVDFSQDLMLVSVMDSSGDKPTAQISIYGVLKNEALFSMNIQKLGGGKDSVMHYGTNRILLTGGFGPAFAWNDEIFVLSLAGITSLKSEMTALYADSTDTRPMDVRMEELKDKIRKLQRNTCFDLLTPRGGNSIASNPHFASTMASAGDIRSWSNGQGMFSSMEKLPAEVRGFFAKMMSFQGTDKATITNFENGRISMKTSTFLKPDIDAIYRQQPMPVFSPDLARLLPPGKPLMLMMSSTSPELARNLMSKSGMGDLLKEVTKKLPFDISSFQGAFGRNMMMAVMSTPNTANDEEGKKKFLSGIQVFVAMPIADKAKFDQLRDEMMKMKDSLSGEGKGKKLMKDFNPSIKYNDKLCVAALSDASAMAVLNNPGTTPLPSWLEETTAYPVVMDLNLHEILSMLFGKAKDEPKNQEMMKSIGLLDQIVMRSGHYENGSLQGVSEIRFSDPDKNAMEQLFQLINTLSSSNRKSIGRNENNDPQIQEGEKVESTPYPPPPPPMEEVKEKPKKTPPSKSKTKNN